MKIIYKKLITSKEYEVDEIFDYDGDKFKCTKSFYGCEDCHFNNGEDCGIIDLVCCSSERGDKIDVVFKLLN